MEQCELLVVWHRHLFGIGLYLGATYGGGSCLFMCIAEHVYNTPKDYEMDREQIVDHICRNWDDWSQDVLAAYTEENVKSKDDYKNYMGKPNEEGGLIELTAFCKMHSDVNFRVHFITGRAMIIGNAVDAIVHNIAH